MVINQPQSSSPELERSQNLKDLKDLKGQQGQAVLEYILLIVMIVSAFNLLAGMISRTGMAKKLATAVTGPFAKAYKYGHPEAKGADEGGADMHPRVLGGNNFRIFLNPDVSG